MPALTHQQSRKLAARTPTEAGAETAAPIARLAVRALLTPVNDVRSRQVSSTDNDLSLSSDASAGDLSSSIQHSFPTSTAASASGETPSQKQSSSSSASPNIVPEAEARVIQVDERICKELNMRKIDIAVLELTVDEQDQAAVDALANRMKLHRAFKAMRSLTTDSKERQWQDRFVKLCNVIEAGLRCGSGEELLQVVGDKGRFVSNSDQEVKLKCEGGRPTFLISKLNILVLHSPSQDVDGQGTEFFSDMMSFGEVKSLERGKQHLNEEEEPDVVLQLSRYMMSLIRDNACVAVSHAFTLLGPQLRLYRFDSQSYCCSEEFDVTDPKQLKKLIMFVAFLTDAEQSLVKFSPTKTFTLIRDVGDAASADKAQSAAKSALEQWEWAKDHPRPLEIRESLFGRRTCCWGGQARQMTESDDDESDYKSVVIKMSWQPRELVLHEVNMLRVLKQKNVKCVPQLLGQLQVPSDVLASHSPTDRVLRAETSADIQLDTVVSECEIGSRINMQTKLVDLVALTQDASKVLLEVAQAGITFRDVSMGNVLLVSGPPRCLLIDFGHSRLHNEDREPNSAHELSHRTTQELKKLVSVYDAEFRRGTQRFVSLSAVQALELNRKLGGYVVLLETCRKMLAHFEKSGCSNEAIREKKYIKTHQEAIEKLCIELQDLRLRPFDDLVSLWYLFLYEIGLVSPALRIWKALVSLEVKRDILTLGRYVHQNLLQDLKFPKETIDVLDCLAGEVFDLLESRSGAIGASDKQDSTPTPGEESVFNEFHAAFATARQRLEQLEARHTAVSAELPPANPTS